MCEMNKKQILKMVKDIIFETDYDLGKTFFDESCMEDPDAAHELQESLVGIVQSHLDKVKKAKK